MNDGDVSFEVHGDDRALWWVVVMMCIVRVWRCWFYIFKRTRKMMMCLKINADDDGSFGLHDGGGVCVNLWEWRCVVECIIMVTHNFKCMVLIICCVDGPSRKCLTVITTLWICGEDNCVSFQMDCGDELHFKRVAVNDDGDTALSIFLVVTMCVL